MVRPLADTVLNTQLNMISKIWESSIIPVVFFQRKSYIITYIITRDISASLLQYQMNNVNP